MRARSAVWLDAGARDAVHALKYRGLGRVAQDLADVMARHLPQPPAGAALVPVPLAPRRQRERGYNQSARLATALSARWNIPLRDCLVRRRETRTQTALTPEARLANVAGAFETRIGERGTRNSLVLVDDVFTTGSSPMAVRVGINGFGRIGRNVLRAAVMAKQTAIEFVAVNDITDTKTLAHLLKYDSVHRRFPGTVEAKGDALVVNGKEIKVSAIKEPDKLPWKALGVDVVLESTGRFTDRVDADRHITAGARKVIISAPAKGEDITIVMGVNDQKYDPAKHHVLSNASCTTNCLVPVVKVVLDNWGFKHGFMTTVHSYTNDQQILDLPHKDLRRARAAALSIIPTTTGAAKATALVLPEVKGKIDGVSLRVPTPDVSIVDLTAEVEKKTTVDEVNAAFKQAAQGALKGILSVSDEPLVSVDYIGSLYSSVVDSMSTNVIDGTLIHISSWYDNEMGYSARCVDLMALVASRR